MMRKVMTATVPCLKTWTNSHLFLLKRSVKAKSPAKSGPMNWPPAEVDVVSQNRYATDRPKMKDYRCNYLSSVDKKTFNLKKHSKYLNIILSKPGITQDVVFTVEQGGRT